MKKRLHWLAVPLVVFHLGSCEKKSETTTTETTPAPAAAPASTAPGETTPPPAPAPQATALTADERAAKLGFVKHLPQDTEAVIAFYNGKKSVERASNLKLWKLIEEQMGGAFMGGPGMELEEEPMEFELEEGDLIEPEDSEQDDAEPEIGDLDEEPAADDPAMEEEDMEMLEPISPGDLLGNEFTVALGKSAGEQTGNLLTLQSRYNYFLMRSLSKAFVTAVKTGDPSGVQEMMNESILAEVGMNLLSDPESGTALLDRSKMPPLYFAYRVDEDKRESALQQLASSVEFLAMFEEQVEPLDFEHAGGTFAGYRVVGSKIAASMAESREDMESTLGADNTEALLTALAKKDLVVVAGSIGEYVVLFVGSSKDDFKLVNTNADSLAAGNALAYVDAYASQDVAALIHGAKPGIDALKAASTGLSDMAQGIRAGLGESEGLGDTRDLEAMLGIVAEREEALMKLAGTEAFGLVAFFDQGLRVETFGGSDAGAFDYTTPPKLSHLGDASDNVLFVNMTADAAYDEKARAYFEALVETAYAMALKISQVEMDTPEMEQFKEMFAMFDTKFRGDLVAMWDAFSKDFSGGVGLESAIVMDLKGGMPAFPGIPQQVVDNGRFMRASWIMPVKDRAKLKDAWTKMNTSSTSLLAKISEMAGEDIPMQKPISSEKDGYTTWFFSLPFTSDDFMPSVTINDQWFVASTSRTHAMELATKASTPAGAPRLGMTMDMNFVAIQQFAKETLAMLEENSAEIFGEEEFMLKEFEEQKEMIGKFITAMDDLDKMTVHTRRENGALRSSVHFKTR